MNAPANREKLTKPNDGVTVRETEKLMNLFLKIDLFQIQADGFHAVIMRAICVVRETFQIGKNQVGEI